MWRHREMIIGAIRDVGEIVSQRSAGSSSMLEDLVGKPSKTKNAKIFAVVFKQREGELPRYEGIEVMDFKESELRRYLYKRGSSRGTDTLPTSVITAPMRTLNIKFFPWFEKTIKDINHFKEEANLTGEELDQLQSIAKTVLATKNQIIEDLMSKHAETNPDKKANHLLTLMLRFQEPNGHYKDLFLGDISMFRKIMLSSGLKSYWFKHDTESRGRGICFGCNQEKEVLGFTGTFPFYTMDKKNFAPDLQVSDAWRLFPMCVDCILLLENGKKFLDEYLKFTYYGYQYYLIPEFLLPATDDLIEELFTIFEGWKDESRRKIILQSKHLDKVRNLTNDENEMLEVLGEEENVIALTFLFFTQPQKSQMIPEMVIPQVLPTRIKELYEAKNHVEKREFHDFLNYLPMSSSRDDDKSPLEFTFQVLSQIFRPKDDAKTKEFLKVTQYIFKKIPLSMDHVFSRTMSYVRRRMYDMEGNFSWSGLLKATLKSFQALHYLSRVGALSVPPMTPSHVNLDAMVWIDMSLKEEILQFFEQNSQFFDNDVKKACFLVGVLTGRLLQVQYADKKSMPFWNKLNNLQVDEKRLKSLLPKVINKLQEYDHRKSRRVQDLEALAGQYLIAAGENWKLSGDMISYYFTLGLSLYKKFFPKKDAAENGEDE